MAGKLKINPNVTISGLLDFQGDDYVQFSEDASVTGNRTIKFNIWLDQDSGYSAGSGIISLGDIRNDHIVASLEGSNMYFYTSTSGGGTRNRYCSITGFDNQVLLVEITKSEESIDSVTFNGASQSLTNNILSKNTGGNDYVGRDVAGYLSNATVWNVEVVGEFKVLGYPGGNLDSAWEDQIGTSDGDVFGSPGTRNIIGVQSGSVASMTKRLKIDQIIPPGGIFELNKKLLLKGTFIEQPFLTFVTNASTLEFDPAVSYSEGTAIWDLGDGSIVEGSGVYHNYSQVGDKTVKVYLGTVPSVDNIYQVAMFQDNLKGTLDLSEFSELNYINVQQNTELDEILLPTTDTNFNFYASLCNLSGVIDLSGLANLSSVVLSQNYGITGILVPPNPSIGTSFNAFFCDITGTLDVSSLELRSQFTVANNPNMTNLILPEVNAGAVTSFYLYSNPGLTHDIDLSGWSNMSGTIHTGGSRISALKLPGSSGDMASINISSNPNIMELDVSGLTFPTTGMNNLSLNTCASLNKVVFPDTDVKILTLSLQSCDLSGHLDLSTVELSRGGYENGTFFCYGNKITGITHKDSSGGISDYRVYGNELIGTLDVSGLTGIYNVFYAQTNSSLCEILFPEFTNYWTYFSVNDCSLNQSTVDDIFSKMYTYYNSNPPEQALAINTSGGTNMPPTDGSSNTNILSLESIFSGAGQTLTITINNP